MSFEFLSKNSNNQTVNQPQQYGTGYMEHKIDTLAMNGLHNQTFEFWQAFGDQLLFHLGQALLKPIMEGVQKFAQDPNADINTVVEECVKSFDQELQHDKLFHDDAVQAAHNQRVGLQEQYMGYPSPSNQPMAQDGFQNTTTGGVQGQQAQQRTFLYGQGSQQPVQGQQQMAPNQQYPQGQQQPQTMDQMGQDMKTQTTGLVANLFGGTMMGLSNMANQKTQQMMPQQQMQPQYQQQQYQQPMQQQPYQYQRQL